MAWAKARPGQAKAKDLGLGLGFSGHRPPEARPKPWLSGQAKPAHWGRGCDNH